MAYYPCINLNGGGGSSDSGSKTIDDTSITTYDADYVEISNRNFVLKREWVVTSESVAIDDGFCSKVTPFVTDITVDDVVVV